MGAVLRSRFFWFLVIVFVPFFVSWILWGLIAATFIVMGVCFLGIAILTSGAKRRRRYYYYDDDDDYDYDEYYYEERPRRSGRSDIQRGMDWHVPKVNRKGADFITGSSGIRKRQERAMNKTKKNFWG